MEKRVVGLEVRGRGHVETGLPCQDKTYTLVVGEVACIALADGAGSAQLSHIGAELVAKAVALQICTKFNDFITGDGKQFILSISDVIRTTLNGYIDNNGGKISELSSTLLVVAANDEFFVALHLGDGVIVGVKNDRAYVVSHPDNGEFVNSTYFTTSSNLESKIRIYKGKVGRHSGFAIMSDGTAESFYQKKLGVVAQSVSRIIEGVSTVDSSVVKIKLCESFNGIIAKKTMDDCSLAVLSFYKNLSEYNYKKQCDLLGLRYGRRRSKWLVDSYNKVIEFVLNNQDKINSNCYDSKIVCNFCRQTGISKRALKRRIIKIKARGLI